MPKKTKEFNNIFSNRLEEYKLDQNIYFCSVCGKEIDPKHEKDLTIAMCGNCQMKNFGQAY